MKLLKRAWQSPASIGLVSFLLTTSARASFELDGLERFGGVKVEGYLEYQDYDFSQMVVRSDALGFHDAGLNTLDHAIDLQGLAVNLPYVSAAGVASASQYSEYDGTTLRFQASNSISISGYSGIGALFGATTAVSNFQATFLVNSATTIKLNLSSDLVYGGAYTFSLAKNTGEIAWDRSALTSSEGQPVYSFERQLTLTPGFYILNASLKALGGVDPSSWGATSTASAIFSVSVVPEPSNYLLLAAGVITIATSQWRKKSASSHATRLTAIDQAVEHPHL